MSHSKLESLPNEVLCYIIEKHINGVDLLTAFSYQLNQRFDAIIRRSRRFRFNFIQCHKDEFRFCIGLLPAYMDKIEHLAISEQGAPGQVSSFLSFFPMFDLFCQLRTLYFDFDYDVLSPSHISRALNSLLDSNIETLTITAVNMDSGSNIRYAIPPIFAINSLKRFTLKSDICRFEWSNMEQRKSNIEYLTISGVNCTLNDLVSIFKLAPRLKYLDIEDFNKRYLFYNSIKRDAKENNVIASELHTLILSFSLVSSVTIQMLAQYLNCMPVLNRLEINLHTVLLDANAWKLFFETSLPSLTHFHLRIANVGIEKNEIENLLASFQSSYWVAKKNFTITITDHVSLRHCLSKIDNTTFFNDNIFEQSVTRCWIAPKRTFNSELVKVNTNINCLLIDKNSNLLRNYYFDSVKSLVVKNIHKPIIQWLTNHVNSYSIKKLFIVTPQKTTDTLTELMSFAANINFLTINYNLFVANMDALKFSNNHIKYFDISLYEHTFNEQDIILIGQCFPYLEHLYINTANLDNVPLIKKYLKYLRSLNFKLKEHHTSVVDDDLMKRRLLDLQKTKFLYSIKNSKVTVWMDENVFDDRYWQTWAVESSQDIVLSTPTTSANNLAGTTASGSDKITKKFKWPFSFFS